MVCHGDACVCMEAGAFAKCVMWARLHLVPTPSGLSRGCPVLPATALWLGEALGDDTNSQGMWPSCRMLPP